MTVSRLFWLAQHAYTGYKIMGRCLGIIPTKLWLSSLMRSVMIEISCLTVLYQVSSLQLGTLFLYKSERASLSTTMVFLCFFLKGCFLNLRWEVTWSEASEFSQLVTCWQEQSNSCPHTLPSCFRRGPDSNPSFGDINQSSIVFGTQICNLRSTYFMCQTSSSLNARNTTFYINKAVWGSWGTNHGRDTCQALSGG